MTESNVKTVYVFQSPQDHLWYWRAKAGNNEIVAQGEAFDNEHDAKRAAEGVFPWIEVERAKNPLIKE